MAFTNDFHASWRLALFGPAMLVTLIELATVLIITGLITIKKHNHGTNV